MGTIAFVASAQQPSAQPYYKVFLSEPVQPSGFLVVDDVVPLKSIDVFNLLMAIARRASENVLTVTHGVGGGGLDIPLVPKKKNSSLGRDQIVVLNKCADGSFTVDEAAARLELLPIDVFALRQAILNVRRHGINKLVMRACELGSHPDTLEDLRRLFGATSACAPDNLDLFAIIRGPLPASKRDFAKFIDSTGVIVEGSVPNRFAWKADRVGLKVNFKVKIESQIALADWISRHFPKGKYPGRGTFHIHTQISDDRIIFPLDPEYRKHLVHTGIRKSVKM